MDALSALVHCPAMPRAQQIVVVYAHPYPQRSRAGRALVSPAAELPQVEVRSLYDRYPDFDIDVGAEQRALSAADVVVWQSPFYWYGLPALFHLWFEKVLTEGWAYGPGGEALAGKRLQWVTTTGTPREAYRKGGMHDHAFDAFVPAIQQTARFCGMRWEPPFVVHGVNDMSEQALAAHARAYVERLAELSNGEGVARG